MINKTVRFTYKRPKFKECVRVVFTIYGGDTSLYRMFQARIG
jgi:hypothetical protein